MSRRNTRLEDLAKLAGVSISTASRALNDSPAVNARTKQLLLATETTPLGTLLDEAADRFAEAVTGPEGTEGTLAFVQKRKPEWCEG